MGKYFLQSLLTALVGGLVAGIVVLAFFHSSFGSSQMTEAGFEQSKPGMDALAAYRCPRGEIKRIFVHGKEDEYSPEGHEPGRIYEKLLEYGYHKYQAEKARDYDEGGLDKIFYDYFEIPANISNGLFVIGLKILRVDNNESISVGDSYHIDDTASLFPANTYGGQVDKMVSAPEWQQITEHKYAAELSKLAIPNLVSQPERRETLLAYVQSGLQTSKKTSRIDIVIGDDTMVDFAAFAICEKPDNSRGVTLVEYGGFKGKLSTTSLLSCKRDVRHMPCDAIHGDTVCSAELPVACIKPGNHTEPPEELDGHPNMGKHWSGGEIAYTVPVRGDRFSTIRDANAYCVAEFGEGWRVISWHDGGGHMVIAKTSERKPGLRAWIDIRDQPYGTCWSR